MLTEDIGMNVMNVDLAMLRDEMTEPGAVENSP
jgi:hypothetical protein